MHFVNVLEGYDLIIMTKLQFHGKRSKKIRLKVKVIIAAMAHYYVQSVVLWRVSLKLLAIYAKVQRTLGLINKRGFIWHLLLSPFSILYLSSRVCYSMPSINSIGTKIRMQSSCRESIRSEWDSIQFDLFEKRRNAFTCVCALFPVWMYLSGNVRHRNIIRDIFWCLAKDIWICAVLCST